MKKTFLCIDLKCFFASVECTCRNLDPFVTDLVVADPSRGEGAICLAITPSLKAKGIRNRCRVFEIPKDIKYIVALPRMKKYIEYSALIYSIYLKYVSAEDILIYSIDECFLDVTTYLKMYKLNAKQLAKRMIDDVYNTTHICATVGIGTNMFLAKVALDITAKHVEDHMGYLDEEEFKKQIWHHRPITDIWNIGKGTANRLSKYGVYDLYDVSQMDEKILFKEFGIEAQFLIDHSKGIEPCSIKEVHDYQPINKSLSYNQILFEDYKYDDALLVIKEMVEVNVLDLVERHLVTNNIALYVGYSKDSYKPCGVSMKLDEYTNSYKILKEYFLDLFIKNVNKNYLIRRIGISFNNVCDDVYRSYSLFTDEEELEQERKIQETIIDIKKKFGKNSIIKAMNLKEKGTTIKRNKLIGGHNSE